MDFPYKVKHVMLLSVYFHKVALLQQIVAGGKIIIFSRAVIHLETTTNDQMTTADDKNEAFL